MTCQLEFLTIIQGEDRTLALRVANADQSPYDLTGATAIKARFKKSDGTVLEKTGTATDAHAGRISVVLAAADTNLLLVGPRQDFSLVVEKPAGKRKVNFRRAISVEKEAV
jgi:hypothetical protein